MSDVTDFLNSSSTGYKSVTFPNIGDSIKGVVTGIPRVVDLKNDDGEIERKLLIDLCDDEGEMWTLWVKKGWMAGAIKEALTKAGATNVAEGGTLVVKFTGEGERKKAGWSPPKFFEAAYKPPAPTAGSVDDLLN